jgi:hypothetical protein
MVPVSHRLFRFQDWWNKLGRLNSLLKKRMWVKPLIRWRVLILWATTQQSFLHDFDRE